MTGRLIFVVVSHWECYVVDRRLNLTGCTNRDVHFYLPVGSKITVKVSLH